MVFSHRRTDSQNTQVCTGLRKSRTLGNTQKGSNIDITFANLISGKTHGLLRLVTILVCLWSSAPAGGVELALEVAPGAAFPLSTFIDRYPVETTLNFGTDTDPALIPGFLRVNLNNDTGFAIALTMLINAFEVRYSLNRHTWAEIEQDALSIELDSVPFLENVFFDAKTFGLPRVVSRDGDEGLQAIFLHRLLGGYRFYLLDGEFRPYIPFAIGIAMVHGSTFDTIFGGAIEIGAGAEFDVASGIAVGIDMRYSANIMENPALDVTGLVNQAAQAARSSSSLFESVVEVFQLFTISATARFSL
ncbi:MAG: hypothetical protein HUU55_22200 [Myxococcales bacterium]|nr:hypothetical protein [Myxococcales bacterium]